MQQEHKNTITQHKHNKLKTRLGHLLWRLAGNGVGPIRVGLR